MNALAKRISHPKWTEVTPILDIIDKAVSHDLWCNTRIDEGAAQAIVDRVVDLPPLTSRDELQRANTLLAMLVQKVVQKRIYAKLGIRVSGGVSMIVAREHEKERAGFPWTSSIIENTPGGAGLVAHLNPNEFDAWVDRGRVSEKTALTLAVRNTRDIRFLEKVREQADESKRKSLDGRIRVYLSVLDKISGRVEADARTWKRLAKRVGIQSLDDFQKLEDKYDRHFPRLKSGLKKAFLQEIQNSSQESRSSTRKAPKI